MTRRGKVSKGAVVVVFAMAALAAPAGAAVFSNATPIAIPATGTGGTQPLGAASPYPSTINVFGMSAVSAIDVTLSSISHTFPDDIDVVLISPSGESVLLMSDNGDTGDVNNVTLTFSDAGATTLPEGIQISSGTFKPSDGVAGACSTAAADVFPAPVPAGPYGTTMAGLLAGTINGDWSLYVHDDCNGDIGSFALGWSINVTGTYIPPTFRNTRRHHLTGWRKVSTLYAAGTGTRVSLRRKTGGRCWFYTGKRFERGNCRTTRGFATNPRRDWRASLPKIKSLPDGSYRLVVRGRSKDPSGLRDVARFHR